MIHFIGDSYAALTLKEAARRRGLPLTNYAEAADLVFVSQDAPTDKDGNRDMLVIRDLLDTVPDGKPIVLTSQVTPGFTRTITGLIYHQAETLRIEDGPQRAMFPEMFIVGAESLDSDLIPAYLDYLVAFDCPVLLMTYEDAEFAKIAINMTLASQVDNANRLSVAGAKSGADWGRVCRALRHDSRIGKYSYLTPGRWQNSPHLLRDHVTLESL